MNQTRYDRKMSNINTKAAKNYSRYSRNIGKSQKTVMSDDSQAVLKSSMTPKIAAARYQRRADKLVDKAQRVEKKFSREIY